MRRSTPIVILTAAIVLLAGCRATGGGAGTPSADAAASVTVEAAETDAGTSLVGPDGMTLYVFTQDSDGTSTCTDGCADTWPPFTVDPAASVEAGDGVTGALATIEREDGATQVTYDGMPLYFYAQDSEPGDATGDGVGGVWHAVGPDGSALASPSDEAEASDDDDGGADDDASPTDDPYD